MGCTFENTCYETRSIPTRSGASKRDNRSIPFRIYDTVGLNEGEQGRVPHWKAVQALYTLIRGLNGVTLLIYCMRGRIKENSRANWNLFHTVICGKEVPAIVVVTGLEHEENLKDGKQRKELMTAFKKYQIFPEDLACVVSIRGKHNEHEELYNWSQRELRGLIAKNYLDKPWSTNTDKWFAKIYSRVPETGCFSSTSRVEFVENVGNVVSEMIKETGMKKEDEKKLRTTLLQAERKFQKRRFL